MLKKEKKYTCRVCFKGLTRPSTLVRHVERQHKNYEHWLEPETKLMENQNIIPKAESQSNENQLNSKKANTNFLQGNNIKKVKEEVKQETKELTDLETFKLGLNEQQRKVFELVEQGKNVFLTGSAGTGKSFLLKRIVSYLRSKYKGESKTEQELAVAVTSTTGINITNIRGTTIHSFAGIKIYSEESYGFLLSLAKKSEAKRRWKRVKHLIIDEVSMLSGDFFNKLEWIARTIRENQKPFGGIQIILSGDFCQLPPVVKKTNQADYCFEAVRWKHCISHEVELTEIFRQKTDLAYLTLLQNLRYNKLSEADIQLIKTLGREIKYDDGINPVKLFATNEEADNYNQKQLAKINLPSRFYKAKVWGMLPIFLNRLLEWIIAPEILELKVSARVMLINNYPQDNLWNGSQGIVIGFDNGFPKVKFTNGKIKTFTTYEWNYLATKADGEVTKRAYCQQVPLILSWGITIHKSQGQTIDRLEVDCGRVFADGHIYTAFSRCPASHSLKIVNFDISKIRINEKVKKYYLNLSNKQNGS